MRRSRRDFIRLSGASALAAGVAGCAPTAPAAAPDGPAVMITAPPIVAEPAATPPTISAGSAPVPPERRILVVLQLSGGDDGLNALVPYGDGLYYQLRPQLAIAESQVLPLNGQLGLHPSLQAFKKLYDEGKLALIQGVGYQNPSRSHFRSMDIWHTARTETPGGTDQGWLGAFMSQVYRAHESPFQCVNLGNSVPRALLSSTAPTAALQEAGSFQFLVDKRAPFTREPLLKTFGQMYGTPGAKLPTLDLVSNTWESARLGVAALSAAAERYRPTVAYPTNPLGKALQQVAQMIAADLGTRVFYVSLGGFDTHANQRQTHASLLGQVADSLATFQRDLEGLGQADRVLVMGFSEFGRRVRENGSNGTDHGAAGPMFVIGSRVRAGLYGDQPRLDSLDDGDLRHTVDFRQVYATILDGWLGVSPRSVLGGSFDSLGFLQT